MIEVVDLLGMQEVIDRRGFVRRLFAIGAGIAVGGELIRQVTLEMEARQLAEDFLNSEVLMSGRAILTLAEQGRSYEQIMAWYADLQTTRRPVRVRITGLTAEELRPSSSEKWDRVIRPIAKPDMKKLVAAIRADADRIHVLDLPTRG